ncbi:MAG TPA: hypothetical protein PKM56_02555 [Candidatus Rifleibacterium sp.]|nr:hypothetical protein [Candidatus Rifleibacterium sp.]
MHSGRDNLERAAQALRWRYGTWAAILASLWLMTAWNFLTGLVFLICRQAGLAELEYAGFALAGLPISLLVAALLVRRRISGTGDWLAVIDSHNRGGGLLLATHETGDFAWSGSFPSHIRVPEIKILAGRPLFSLVLSIIFVILCLKIPVITGQLALNPHLDLNEAQQKLEEQITALAEAGMLAPDEAKELQQGLERIIEGSDRKDPASTFEAIDQLEDRLKKRAAAGVHEMATEIDAMSRLQSLADQLADSARSGSGDALPTQALARQIASTLEKSTAGKVPENMQRALDQTAAGGPGSREAAAQAEKELREHFRKEAEKAAFRAERLANARLIDQKTFEELAKAGKIRPADESDFEPGADTELLRVPSTGSCNQGGSGKEGSGQGASGQQGSGQGSDAQQNGTALSGNDEGTGASGQAGRGGGTGPVNFDRRSSEHNVKFIDEALPPPNASALEQSVSIGVSISAPQTETSVSHGNSASTVWQKPADSSGESGIILPKHRSAVKKYFNHEAP